MARDVQVSAGGVYDLGLHVVWCPKYRSQVLSGQAGIRLRELIDAKAAEHGWRIVACEIMPGHVHLFVKTTPKDSPAFARQPVQGLNVAGAPAGVPAPAVPAANLVVPVVLRRHRRRGQRGDRAAVHRHAV